MVAGTDPVVRRVAPAERKRAGLAALGGPDGYEAVLADTAATRDLSDGGGGG